MISTRRAGEPADRAQSRDVNTNTLLRIVLLVWVLGYLLVSCGPLLGGHLFVGSILAIAGLALFIPWLLGVLVLIALIWVTNSRPPR